MNMEELFKTKEDEKFLKQAVDFYDLFSIIQELLKELDLLNEGDTSNPDKVSFKMSYPTEFYSDIQENIVTFDLYQRTLTEFKTSAGSITQKRPHTLVSFSDPVSGLQKELKGFFFQNKVQLYVYSASTEKLYQILKTLETILLRYKEWFNTNYRVRIEYNGILSEASGHNLYHNKMFCKIIQLTAYTEAHFENFYERIEKIHTI